MAERLKRRSHEEPRGGTGALRNRGAMSELRRQRWLRRRGHIETDLELSPSRFFAFLVLLDFLVFLAFQSSPTSVELLVVVCLGSPALAKELFCIRQRQAVVIVDLLLLFFLFFVPSFRLPEVAEGEVVVLDHFFLALFVLAHGLLIRDRFLTRDEP
jgi:hypothetical protein